MDVRVFFSLTLLVLVGCVMMAEGRPSRLQSRLSVQPNGCSCEKQADCGCCVDIFYEDACVNITYLPRQNALSLTFALDGEIFFNETVSATNPPPFCFEVPHVELLKVCIRLYNISYAEEHFGGCISLELDYFYFKKNVDLGCIYDNQLEVQSKGTPRDIFTPRDILLWIFGEDKLKTVKLFR